MLQPRTWVFRRWAGTFAGILLMLAGGGMLRAQKGSNWRVYRAADGMRDAMATWVTASPRGNIWVSHGPQTETASKLDGYSVRTIPTPGAGNFPVFESRSGQLWSIYNEGLMLYSHSNWTTFPVREIEAVISGDVARKVRSIPLVPAEVDHVFFLLPTGLMEFDASSRRTVMIRAASQSQLVRFNEMVESRDGGLWITGLKGIAKVPGPARQLKSATPWEEFVVDAELGAENLQRPSEDDAGGITTLGEYGSPAQKLIVYFDGRAWGVEPPVLEKVRYAWRAADGGFWQATRDALLHTGPGGRGIIERPEFGAAHITFFDVLPLANDVFWLATSDGVIRHSRNTWQPPFEVEEESSTVYGICEDRNGDIWFADAGGLFRLRAGQWSRFAWPANFESYHGLEELPDGRLIIGSRDRPMIFSPASGEFTPFPARPGRHPGQLLGKFRDGAACLYVP
ncbi:MAG TPA: two-component regulator propeller domain-containing protein, partial [Verrucomicrobiae bacterium]|nr:two-component regulator propeller domain-containing protein [Verrucomicrobiae bacterium]